MKTKFKVIYLLIAISAFVWSGCTKEGPQGYPGQTGATGASGTNGADGQDATVYYSEWFSPTSWTYESGEWYFSASAPDLTASIVESGVVLAYVWLAGDYYNATSVRPLPAYAVGANWSYLIHQYGYIEFSCDMISQPSLSHQFRFIAIPGTISALKSAALNGKTASDLKSMPYKDVCKLLSIPE